MNKTKSITLSVHKAIMDDSFPWTLSDLLGQMKAEVKSGDLVVDRGLYDKTAIKFPSFPQTNKSVAAQFALYEEGAEKSTIRPVGENETYSTAPLPAPKEVEFLEHEVAILADGNFMVACGLGQRQGLLVDAIGKLADRCSIEMHPTALGFASTPNRLTVERIRSIGVKSVRFDAANFLGSLNIPNDSLLGGIFGGMATDAVMQKQEMVAELSIHPKSRKRAILDAVETPKNEWLERTAVKTFQDKEVSSYTIILNDDTEWEEGDLKLRRKVNVARDGSTFSMPEAMQAMLDYLDELRTKGLLG